jgi:hypothetical protein
MNTAWHNSMSPQNFLIHMDLAPIIRFNHVYPFERLSFKLYLKWLYDNLWEYISKIEGGVLCMWEADWEMEEDCHLNSVFLEVQLSNWES